MGISQENVSAREPTPGQDTTSAKRRLRQEIRRARGDLGTGFRREAATGLHRGLSQVSAEHPDGSILAFLPTAQEPPVEFGLRELARSRGLWLPVTRPGRQLMWSRLHAHTEFAPTGPGGLLEPIGARFPVPDDTTCIVVPCLALDDSGCRLGMGGGVYDTLLADLAPAIERIGCVFSHEILPTGTVPVDPWDARLDRALTERGLHQIAA